jgi:hypothetical protein
MNRKPFLGAWLIALLLGVFALNTGASVRRAI